MKSIALILVCSHFFTLAFCQDRPISKSIAISCEPIALISSPNPQLGFQVGTEYRLNKKFSISGDIVFPIPMHGDNASFPGNKFFKTKSEIRYYFPKHWQGLNTYFGLQMNYTYRKFEDQKYGEYFGKKEDTLYYSYDQSKIKSPFLTFTFQAGSEFFIAPHFFIDIYGGLGVRICDTHYYDIVNQQGLPLANYKWYFSIAPTPLWKYDAVKTGLQLNCGLRFLYYFHK